MSTPLHLRLLPNTFISSLEEHSSSEEDLLSNGLSHDLLIPPADATALDKPWRQSYTRRALTLLACVSGTSEVFLTTAAGRQWPERRLPMRAADALLLLDDHASSHHRFRSTLLASVSRMFRLFLTTAAGIKWSERRLLMLLAA